MLWIAPSEKDTDNAALEKRLWDAGMKCEVRSMRDEVRSGLTSDIILLPLGEGPGMRVTARSRMRV